MSKPKGQHRMHVLQNHPVPLVIQLEYYVKPLTQFQLSQQLTAFTM